MRYSKKFKKEVAKKALSPGVISNEICRKLNISSSSVRRWKNEYREELLPEVEKLWAEAEATCIPEEEEIDIEALLLEASRKEYEQDEEEKLPNLGEVLLKKKKISQYAPEEKYVVVNKVRSLDEEEQGRFLRQNGFRKKQIEIWEDELLIMSKKNIKNEDYISQLEEENKKLKKNLKDRDRENEELKVLIELKKKYPSLFKDEKDD